MWHRGLQGPSAINLYSLCTLGGEPEASPPSPPRTPPFAPPYRGLMGQHLERSVRLSRAAERSVARCAQHITQYAHNTRLGAVLRCREAPRVSVAQPPKR